MTHHELQQLSKRLEETPATLKDLVSSLGEGELSWKPSASAFSFVEHVCHLRDIEREGYALRIAKILSEHQPFLPDIDGEKLAVERAYNSQPLDTALDAFALARKENVRTIAGLTREQLGRGGVQENVGELTLEALLLKMLEHDHSHLQELNELREYFARPDEAA